MVRVQLTQEKVQKSTSTTLPRRPSRCRGELLIHRAMPVKSGTGWRSPEADSGGGGRAPPPPYSAFVLRRHGNRWTEEEGAPRPPLLSVSRWSVSQSLPRRT